MARRPGIELTVYFCTDQGLAAAYDPGFGRSVRWDVPLLGGYEARFLPAGRGRPADARSLRRLALPVFRLLAGAAYDVLWIHGYGHATAWAAVLAARLAGKPVLLRDDATLLDRRSWPRRVAKELPLRWLARCASGLYVGSNNRRYLERYGFPGQRLFYAPHAVDNRFFQREAARLAPRKAELQRRFGLPEGRPVVLFCGKLSPEKEPLTLLRAFRRVRRRLPAGLLFAGDGPLRGEVEALAAREAIDGVRIAGFLNQSEIGEAYAAADVLVLPSARETWGLVVNEAMCFGLPVVVSDRVGCAADLVHHGRNGYVFPAGDDAALAGALEPLLASAERRRTFGLASRQIIEEFSIERAADGVVRAAAAVAGARAGQ